ncbi:MAG: hypothetical protein KDE56_21950, partial [Anaerolineales bacterium]|nr:hypothetical protein [Anaerolineales bacterium]
RKGACGHGCGRGGAVVRPFVFHAIYRTASPLPDGVGVGQWERRAYAIRPYRMGRLAGRWGATRPNLSPS